MLIVKGKVMINLTKREKDRLGYSLIVGTMFGVATALYAGSTILQGGYLPLEVVAAGFVQFLLSSSSATVGLYILLTFINEIENAGGIIPLVANQFRKKT